MIEQGAGLSRRDLLRLAAGAAGFVVLRCPTAQAAAPGPDGPPADEAIQRLLEGNQRYVKGETTSPRRSPGDFRPLVEGQRPMAVILGCADSRVPPELLFDQGVGDLFVVRVAGNVVSGAGPPVKGSIEYGVAELGVSLVMVLGHTECGARCIEVCLRQQTFLRKLHRAVVPCARPVHFRFSLTYNGCAFRHDALVRRIRSQAKPRARLLKGGLGLADMKFKVGFVQPRKGIVFPDRASKIHIHGRHPSGNFHSQYEFLFGGQCSGNDDHLIESPLGCRNRRDLPNLFRRRAGLVTARSGGLWSGPARAQ